MRKKEKDEKDLRQTVPVHSSPPHRSAKRRLLFGWILCAVPVLVFSLLEIGLRTAGFGHSYPLFIPRPELPEYRFANPDVVKRYFADPALAPSVKPDPFFFRAKKAPGTFRIFVQGESTAAGYPFGQGASLAGMLQVRLQHTFTDRPIEVVSTAMAAVTSYTLLDFVDEIIENEPDAVLMYVGHNEYLGILGVGSAVSWGRNRPLILARLALRDLRIFQLAQRAHTALIGLFPEASEPKQRTRGTLMSRIVGEKYIPYESPLYRQGVRQFEANLNAMLARYRKAGVPVFIGTLASNERDQNPFISRVDPTVDGSQWERRYQEGKEALQRGETDAADAALAEAIRLDDRAADAYYAQAQLFEGMKDYPAARQAYLAAKDRDQLRFRAPERFNQIIRRVGSENGATVVEVQEAFLKKAKNGIIGEELMLEHLHPNVEGYFLLADAYYNAIRAKGFIGAWKNAASYEQASKDIPVTESDRLNGLYKIKHLMSDWPFQPERVPFNPPEPKNPIEALAIDLYHGDVSWIEAMEQLLSADLKNENYLRAAHTAVILAQAFPFLDAHQNIAGQLLEKVRRYREAIFYLNRAVSLKPTDPTYLLALSRAYAVDLQKEPAQRLLRRLLEIEPGHREARRLLNALEAS